MPRSLVPAAFSTVRLVRTVVLACLVVVLAGGVGTAVAQDDGRLSVEPDRGSVGDPVTAVATQLPPGLDVDLVWETADADWNVDVEAGTFSGVVAEPVRWTLASARTDSDGRAEFAFDVPEDYGYIHNLFVVADGDDVARNGFALVPELTVTPASGPVGSDVTVRLTGIGYRFWESVWHLMYDGAHTGWLSAMTTRGTAEIVVPATGEPGLHTLQVMSGAHPVPYLNQQQAPIYKPQIPTVLGATFEVTDGEPVAAPPAANQGLARDVGMAADGSHGPGLGLNYVSGQVGSPIVIDGAGFEPGQALALVFMTVRGNRVSGGGWAEAEVPLADVEADASGAFTVTLDTPDDLGGAHRIVARPASGGAMLAQTVYTVTPSVFEVEPAVVEPGGDITITIKGVGWTETANIYTLLMDNGYLGYGCGFNSRGDVTIHLKAPGREGMHLIEIYPSIYQGVLEGPSAPSASSTANATYLQLPMLNWIDHPGEELPAFRLSFEVRSD